MSIRFPAEWEPQSAIWLAWPHHTGDWPGKFAPIPWVYAEIIRHITRTQTVRLVVKNAAHRAQAQQILERTHADLTHIEWFEIPTNRSWLRDSGPVFVTANGQKTIMDFRSLGWAKYPNYRLDNKVRDTLNETLHLPLVKPRHKGRHVVLEGGGIDSNGAGCLLTTEEWLLTDVQVRNPGFTREDYETIFEKYLGITHTIWLGEGIVGDDTHGHVDDLSRFIDATTIATVVESNPKDENHHRLQDNLKRLKHARDANGKPFTIVELPMPKPLIFEDTRLPASYANFLICNDIVLVPTFNDPTDRIALNLLAECFPTRNIVGIHAVDFVWGFGTLHCMSMQEPV